jgi:uncharacterized protein (DUF4415 family)
MSTIHKLNQKHELLPKKLETKNMRFRVTMMVDLDVLDSIREEASEKRIGYQTLINKILRNHVEGDELNDRLVKLENAVFKKAR